MAKGKARSGFDLDLKDGQFAEGKLAQIFKAKGSKVEVKSDEKCRETGNLFVETRQPDPVLGGLKPSGISVTEAEHWATEIAPDAWLIVPTEKLKEALRIAHKRKGFKFGGDNNRYQGILVSLKELLECVIGRKL